MMIYYSISSYSLNSKIRSMMISSNITQLESQINNSKSNRMMIDIDNNNNRIVMMIFYKAIWMK